ncbi:hypothetical protein [Actinophytocola sp.]|uniref:hypothetical protein n=1 Tax=Actinophytocola sp. TaxID=1872138 RepID=UPI003899A53E
MDALLADVTRQTRAAELVGKPQLDAVSRLFATLWLPVAVKAGLRHALLAPRTVERFTAGFASAWRLRVNFCCPARDDVLMALFVCAGCGAELTAPVARVALPAHADQQYGHELLPALMAPGTYAVNPEPSGPPWRWWQEVGEAEAASRGVYAPVDALSYGSAGAVAVAPGDTRGMALIPDRCEGYCLGLDGRAGPNLACVDCGRAVATRVDDCSFWQAVWLDPDAVRRVDGAAVDWAPDSVPPVEEPLDWSPVWTAAAGVALAHLLVASGGAPVALPPGMVTDMFGHVLDALLPPGPPAVTAALAGPDLPAPDCDIALVPVHPRTGTPWRLPGAAIVPVAAPVWQHLAFQHDAPSMPATRGLLPDDLPPQQPWVPFRPDAQVFLDTLARLPEVRRPWLREIYDRVRTFPRPF